jgi:transposase
MLSIPFERSSPDSASSRLDAVSLVSTSAGLATEPADMRKGIDGLYALARRVTDLDPLGGHLFVFLSRRRNAVKVLLFDQGGFVLLYKRLERGRFTAPVPSPGQRSLAISAADLAMLLGGIDWRAARRTQLWKPDRSVADRGSTTAAA